jgi:hypothetical protein
MRRIWYLLAFAVPSGGAAAVLALVLICYHYSNQPSVPDMALAAGLGAALGGALMLV